MPIDLQRKYRYTVNVELNKDSTLFGEFIVDEFTPPETRREAVTRQNKKMGQITLVGPATYGEATMRLALRIGEATVSDFIDSVIKLHEYDTDTVNITLNTKSIISGVEEVSYSQTYENCKLTGYKLDPLSRKDDGDFVHCEITFIPTRILNLNKINTITA